ncbi:MAG: hypothetical protein GC150_07510 [Rhizobiales bacterium]|nr:hypothetical protein [Hyphomicrobiales bacterium]
MSETVRVTISVKKDKAERIRSMVERGVYGSVSRAYDAASDLILDEELQREVWWAEMFRRCEEAEKHPERLLDPDAFFRDVRDTVQTHRGAKQSG